MSKLSPSSSCTETEPTLESGGSKKSSRREMQSVPRHERAGGRPSKMKMGDWEMRQKIELKHGVVSHDAAPGDRSASAGGHGHIEFPSKVCSVPLTEKREPVKVRGGRGNDERIVMESARSAKESARMADDA